MLSNNSDGINNGSGLRASTRFSVSAFLLSVHPLTTQETLRAVRIAVHRSSVGRASDLDQIVAGSNPAGLNWGQYLLVGFLPQVA